MNYYRIGYEMAVSVYRSCVKRLRRMINRTRRRQYADYDCCAILSEDNVDERTFIRQLFPFGNEDAKQNDIESYRSFILKHDHDGFADYVNLYAYAAYNAMETDIRMSLENNGQNQFVEMRNLDEMDVNVYKTIGVGKERFNRMKNAMETLLEISRK